MEVINRSNNEIIKETKSFIKELDLESEELDLTKKEIEKAIHLLSNTELNKILKNLNNKDYITRFNYSDLSIVFEEITKLHKNIEEIKEEIDIDKFFKKGNVVDFDKLKEKWKDRKLREKFTKYNFKWSVYREWMQNPVTELVSPLGETIYYDKFFIKKLLTAVSQMIFEEMDIYITNCGKEGSGKSCFSSQTTFYLYTFLDAIGLIDYEYDVKKLFFSSLATLLEEQDKQKKDDYFRIRTLDEGTDINRQNYREQTSILFKEDMRTGRKKLEIKQINLPQLGELDTSITLSRTNFIFNCTMDSDVKTGTLKKGEVEMFIIPRGKKIYSPYQKKNLTHSEIMTAFGKKLEKKSEYYMELPREAIIHKFKFENKWGFNKSVYDSYIKLENKKKRFSGGIKLSDSVGFVIMKYCPPLKNWDIDRTTPSGKRMYSNIAKTLNNVKNRFLEDPDTYKKYELFYKKMD